MNTTLDAFSMPFTPNRQFKAEPRLVASAEGIAYRTPDGREPDNIPRMAERLRQTIEDTANREAP